MKETGSIHQPNPGRSFHTQLSVLGSPTGWEAFVVPGAPPTGQAIEKIKYIREASRKWKKWSGILRASG